MASKLTRGRFGSMLFSDIYTHYVNKVIKKGKTVKELHQVLTWLTGYSEQELKTIIKDKVTYSELIDNAKFLKNCELIKGIVRGYCVERIKDDFERKLRYMVKLVDELTTVKKMASIFTK